MMTVMSVRRPGLSNNYSCWRSLLAKARYRRLHVPCRQLSRLQDPAQLQSAVSAVSQHTEEGQRAPGH